jgi:hypothetical protein
MARVWEGDGTGKAGGIVLARWEFRAWLAAYF